MSKAIVRFAFVTAVPMTEVQGTLYLARIAVESLFGIDKARLEARCVFDDADRAVEIDVASRIGRTLAVIFCGYARREFGAECVHMSRLEMPRQELEACK